MVDIERFADILDVNIEIQRYANQDGRYTAKFARCEVKEGGLLRGAYGSGRSASAALADYASNIAGCTLVFNAMDPQQRREYVAPRDLSGAGA